MIDRFQRSGRGFQGIRPPCGDMPFLQTTIIRRSIEVPMRFGRRFDSIGLSFSVVWPGAKGWGRGPREAPALSTRPLLTCASEETGGVEGDLPRSGYLQASLDTVQVME